MEAKHTLRDHKTGPNSKKYRIDNNSMSSFDTPNEMAVKYPNEKQKDYALGIRRFQGLASQVKLYIWCKIHATISLCQAHFAKVRLEYVLVCRSTVLSELSFEFLQVYSRQQLHKRICETL